MIAVPTIARTGRITWILMGLVLSFGAANASAQTVVTRVPVPNSYTVVDLSTYHPTEWTVAWQPVSAIPVPVVIGGAPVSVVIVPSNRRSVVVISHTPSSRALDPVATTREQARRASK